jgi:hypothetical protein
MLSCTEDKIPVEFRKSLISAVCRSKTAKTLGDYIEEKRRPKPSFEILSTDRFSAFKNDNSCWIIRDGKEKLVVETKHRITNKETWREEYMISECEYITFEEGVRRMRESGWIVTVKQVLPEWPLASQGMKFKHLPTGLVYIVTKLYGKTWLNSITEGNVYAEPVDTGYVSFTLGDLVKEDPNTEPQDWEII